MSRILIAEDEARISTFMEKGLRAAGHTPSVVADGITALDYATSGQFDLLILDAGLPRLDGFTVLGLLRETKVRLPVIMVTARTSVHDTVAGLDGGADDYLAKPFRFEELLARIRIRLRNPVPGTLDHILKCGLLELDLHSRNAKLNGKEIELSSREFALAETFMRHPGQVLSREQLLSRVWGYDYDGTSNVVDVYVLYLRKKLGADRLATVRGTGYRLVEV
ncbi:response regulator transcription factor [Arthrobacter sp. MI7-26]|uniref:response regulator transcription factor n=1 Tax=Arthrobacter sp. MI7-26 TaxID=2993653 RepID=UPI00224984F7|nr:response regulator transcription factor [Arthrobacter sp. MI7-26]MCX2749722.1 response regulator transcription factor [Arthrobacter sp. MI7-26]